MTKNISGKQIAILVADGFEKSELLKPRKALDEGDAVTYVISPVEEKVKSWDGGNWGESVAVDVRLEDANADNYDALLLPGGVINPDKLRINKTAIEFIKAFFDSKKPVAAICHGPWTLINAGVVKGKRMTSWPSLEADLTNAGAQWVDEEVVVDQGLVTSRKPDDIPAFCNKMVEEIAEGKHEARKAG
ncbi:MAG TPA: type 1 glutamine amidotransferase domain-containing protein [Gammaproteobacteria bacterium]|nr:type 1 glutamine amidotransferase domain-containing protein [Gammaproteobacteria bacterium]